MSENEDAVVLEGVDETSDTKEVDVQKLIQDGVDSALSGIKGKLDGAFAARDEALRKVAEFEQKQREAELEALKAAGKDKEVYELQLLEKTSKYEADLANEKAKRETLEKKNIELTRDAEVKSQLSVLTFRSDKATRMAFKEIIDELVLDDNGKWVHRSGASIDEYVKGFAKSDDNAFLFKQKVSSGSGSQQPTKASDTNENKSVFKMSQAEVLKRAEAGTLRK